MASRNITIRLSEPDLEFFNNRAKEMGVDRTTLIKRAVKSYQGAIPVKTVPQQTKEVLQSVGVSEKVISIADFSHPLLDIVQSEGVTIQGQDGSKITKIKSLAGLLNFVHKNVLNFK